MASVVDMDEGRESLTGRLFARVPRELADRVHDLAEREGVSDSEIARRALTEYVAAATPETEAERLEAAGRAGAARARKIVEAAEAELSRSLANGEALAAMSDPPAVPARRPRARLKLVMDAGRG